MDSGSPSDHDTALRGGVTPLSVVQVLPSSFRRHFRCTRSGHFMRSPPPRGPRSLRSIDTTNRHDRREAGALRGALLVPCGRAAEATRRPTCATRGHAARAPLSRGIPCERRSVVTSNYLGRAARLWTYGIGYAGVRGLARALLPTAQPSVCVE